MSEEEHRCRHATLHAHFDELVADFICQNPGKRPSNTTVMELMVWSAQQTVHPTEGRSRGEGIPE